MAITLLFERLLLLPLFQGMSHADLNEVVAQTKFGFQRLSRGTTFVREGDPCTHLGILMNGDMQAVSRSDDHSYVMSEPLLPPAIMQPERLFGLTQRYTKTFSATSPCQLLVLSKGEVLRLTERYEIFRLNLLNTVTTQSQRIAQQPWRTTPQTIRGKITRFFEQRSLRPAGEKTLHIKMETLAALLGESRLNVSRELNVMDEKGIIRLTRGQIHIPALERLLNG